VKVPVSAGGKVLMKMIGDKPDSDDGNIADVDELLVEEVSIDGMCGVY
jgi:mycofactocin precursor